MSTQSHLNVDETSHKDNGDKLWTWCFKAYLFTVFKISPSRGSGVLIETLGAEFDGTIGCDYFSAYHKFMRLDKNVKLQFCIAHLIRDDIVWHATGEQPDTQHAANMAKRFYEHFEDYFRFISDPDIVLRDRVRSSLTKHLVYGRGSSRN